MKELFQFPQRDPGLDGGSSHEDIDVQSLELELQKMQKEAAGDLEVLEYLVNKKVAVLIEKKKKSEITKETLLKCRQILEAGVSYKDVAEFKQKELIDAFGFEGNEKDRQEILDFITGKESLSQKGANQKGVFELPNDRIVKVVSEGNYPYELPMVKLTKNLQRKNVIKTYDVFIHGNLTYVVQDKAVGKDFHEYTADEQNSIPQEHYDDLVQLINMYASHGIGTDPSKISNLFYDPHQGFSVIDLGAATYQRGLDYHIHGYFANNLPRQEIEKGIEKFGTYTLKSILPTLKDKLAKLSLS